MTSGRPRKGGLHTDRFGFPDAQGRYVCPCSDCAGARAEGQDVPPVSLSVVRAHVRRQAAGARADEITSSAAYLQAIAKLRNQRPRQPGT